MNNTTTTEITAELYNIFTAINDKYFDGSLPNVFITIKQGKTKGKSVYGTFYPDAWAHKEREEVDEDGIVTEVLSEEYTNEIAMSGEYLSRPLANMAGTLCHEMTHLYCAVNGIEDTSNNGVYHNAKFKTEAEKRGLIIEKAPTIGWSVTTPKEEFIDFINSLGVDEEVFSYFRNTRMELTKTAPKKRWVCPKCGMQAQAKKSVKIGCWECNMQMDYWDLTEEGNEEILEDNNNGYALSDDGWYGYLMN